jgi:hypothetical protein
MISILTCTARSLRSTLESMATPCSVNAPEARVGPRYVSGISVNYSNAVVLSELRTAFSTPFSAP